MEASGTFDHDRMGDYRGIVAHDHHVIAVVNRSSPNKDFSLILSPNHLILASLDSLFYQLSVDSKIVKFPHHLPLNLTFDYLLFIFNLNLGVDLRVQLLSKYKMQLDNFALFGILRLLPFHSYVNCKIWISFV